MKRTLCTLLAILTAFGAGVLCAQDGGNADPVVKRWAELDGQWVTAWSAFKEASVKAETARMDIRRAADGRDALTGTLVRNDKYLAPLQDIVAEKRRQLEGVKRNIALLAQDSQRKQGEMRTLREAAPLEPDLNRRADMLEHLLRLDEEVRVLNLAMDMDQEHALAIGADLMTLGSTASGHAREGSPAAGTGTLYQQSELENQLRQYENERLQYTIHLRKLLDMKERGMDVSKDLEGVARSLDQLDKLIDQTKRALRGYDRPAEGNE